MLRTQCCERGIHVAGALEARTKAGKHQAGQFFALASGGQQRNLGCELWINTAIPYASCEGGGLHFKLAHATPLSPGPQKAGSSHFRPVSQWGVLGAPRTA
eukprot:8273903-Pyramimonas_sp.AAC.1